MEPFDLEAVYDAEIAPLMSQIIEVCKQHRLPMLCTFCFRYDPEIGDDYCTTRIPRDDWQPDGILAVSNALMRSNKAFAFTIASSKPAEGK